jgi:hypothetical protein
MTEQDIENKKAETTKPERPLRWWVLVFLGTALVILVFLWIRHRAGTPSIEQRLAAIEAARAIPDEENAAHLYRELLDSYNKAEFSSYLMDRQTHYVTQRRPWRSADYPDLADWLQGQQDTIDKLKHISTFDKCRFPIGPCENALQIAQQMQSRMALLSPVRVWAQLLICSANNDIGEGRAGAGLEKYLAVMSMAKHFRQQLDMVDYLTGIAIEALALENIRSFVMKASDGEEDLKAVQNALQGQNGQWRKQFEAVVEVDRLLARNVMGPIFLWFTRFFSHADAPYERCMEISLHVQTDLRGVLILAALRRHKDKTGQWPQTLEDIRSLAPEEAFVDPTNGGNFVYRLTPDGFILYSRGPNNIDEAGQYNDEYDAQTAERKILRDDRMIWPVKDKGAEGSPAVE